MGSYRRPISPVPNTTGGKGGGMNANAPLRQQQMGLVPSYTPMQTMGGKGGGKGAPAPSASFNQPFLSQDFTMAGAYQPNIMNQGPFYGGAPAYQQPTQQPVTSPQPFDVSQFGQPGGPGYRPTGTEGDMVQPQPQPAVPEYLRPYMINLGDRRPRPPQGVAVPRPVAGGMRLSRDGYPTRAEIEKLTGMAIRPGDRQGEIDRYNRFMQNQGQTTPPKIVSDMFGTTKARTPAEQALLIQRQAEIDARVAQQNELATQQEEYDKMFGGLTEEQQAFFGDQLQRPEQQPQSGITFDDFMRRQLYNNLFQRPVFGFPRMMQQYTGGIFPQPYNPNRG